jgi:cytochrome b subunit of formate dehydrogenase
MRKDRFILVGLLVSLLLVPSVALHGQSRSDCLACHGDSSLSKEREGKQVSLFADESVLNLSPHRKLVCVACHTGFNPDNVPHKEKINPVNCLTCHGGVQVKHTFHPQLAAALAAHQEPDVSCKDCHGRHDIVSPKTAGSKFSREHLASSCGECHADVKEHFDSSAHGRAIARGIASAPDCITCHQNRIVGLGTGADSLDSKLAQEKVCLSCHLDNPDVRSRSSPSAGFIAAYETSVHGAALRKGRAAAANCVDCHGSHEMKKGLEASATVNKGHIAQTCSQCHAAIAGDFAESVHGKALAKGNGDAPTCTNCHGEHTILRHTDPRSPVASQNVSQQVCAPCHSSVALTAKYGLSADRFKTFSDSYHGLAMRGGSVEAANCASCHGTHNIKSSSDSTSMVNKANLAQTCGKCHKGANQRFSIGSVHVTMVAKEEPVLYWISSAYLILILVTVGGMLFHNLLDFVKKAKRKLRLRQGLIFEEPRGHALYLRMTLSERIQHGTLLVSFVVLVVTGFMLRFPETWWVEAIHRLSDRVFDLRSLIHRIAAVLMVGAGVYHLYHISFTRRGRELIRDLLPRLQDGRDAIAVMKYNLGISRFKPKFDRFSYIEKSEYWALIWGTVVMAVTGCVMWFDNTFIGLLTKLGYDITRTIHYYEAWLATLSILVWHLYYVIFNPDAYPVNLAFWKGTLTEAEMAEEHPLELERLERGESAAISGESGRAADRPGGNGEDGAPGGKSRAKKAEGNVNE